MKPFAFDPDDDRSMFDRSRAGDWYKAEGPEITEACDRMQELQERFNQTYPRDRNGAQAVLRELLAELGEGSHVRAPIFLDYGSRLFIGAGTFVNYNFTALDVCDIRIGKNCQIATNVQLLPPIHPLEAEPRREGWEAGEPITIEDNVWLGGGVIVLGGVTIGENSVIGAGAVVTKDIPPNSIAVGNPARVIREIPQS